MKLNECNSQHMTEKKPFICSHCMGRFKNDLDLQAHQFNNRACPPEDDRYAPCPECLTTVHIKDELEKFGGLCESCQLDEQYYIRR